MTLTDYIPYQERKEGDDCLTISISNILKHKGFSSYKSIYKQSGFVYIKNNSNVLPIIKGDYMDVGEELYLGNRIFFNRRDIPSDKIFIKEIQGLLDNGEPVLVGVDIFNLPYHSNYQNRHSFHYITIIGYTSEAFIMVDDFLLHTGELTYKQLLQATEVEEDARKGNLLQFKRHCISLSIKEAREQVEKDDYFNIIRKNYEVGKGLLDIDKYIESEQISPESSIIFGLSGIKKFIQDLEELIEQPGFFNKDILMELYQMLCNVSNTRYLYGFFLKNGVKFEESFLPLGERYIQLGQDWKITGNFILKTLYKGDDDKPMLLERILKKLKTLVIDEEDAIHESNQLLNNLFV